MKTQNKTARQNAKQSRTAMRQRAQLLTAFIQLPPDGRATLLATIKSMTAAERGDMAEARSWWLVVQILMPDIAQKFGSHLAQIGH